MESHNVSHRQGPLKTPAEALMVARLIWFALLVSQGMYLFIGRLLLAGPPAAEDVAVAAPSLPTLMTAFDDPKALGLTAAALIALAMSFYVPKLMLKRPASGKGAAPSPGDLPARLRARVGHLIIGLGLNETVALIGLAGGFFVLKNPEFGAALIYLSIAVMLLRFPNAELFADRATSP